jgi:hypothetical protein
MDDLVNEACDQVRTASAGSEQDSNQLSSLARETASAILASLYGTTVSDKADQGCTVDLPPKVVENVCYLMALKIWEVLAHSTENHADDFLANAAKIVFTAPAGVAASALAPSALISPISEPARMAVAAALVGGDDATGLAARAGFSLESSYLVVIVEADDDDSARPLHRWPVLERRRDVFAVREDGVTIILIPVDSGMDRDDAFAYGSGRLRASSEIAEPFMAAVAFAPNRTSVELAAEEAGSVFTVVRALGYANEVYRLDDVPVAVSLFRSPDLIDILMHRLRPLFRSGTSLLETVAVYMRQGWDRRSTAEVLRIHLNTLDYRLRRVAALTGLSPTEPRHRQLLEAAIIALQLQQAEWPARWRVDREPVGHK